VFLQTLSLSSFAMILFQRSLVREFTALAVSVGIVLLSISVTTLLIRLLGQAAAGALQVEGVIAFLGFSALNYLPVLLSLTLFIAVLMTLTRWYSESEMIVWFSAGIGLNSLIRPVLYFALPIALVTALLSVGLSPWALRKSAEYQRQLDSRDDVAALAPGVFKESRYADRVFFVDNLSRDESIVSNVFVQSVQQQRLGVMVAKEGSQHVEKNGDKFLILDKGRRYEGTPGTADYKMIDFERYGVRIEPYEAKLQPPSPKTLTTTVLLKQPTPQNMAELHWRIGMPISILILGLLAIPLSYVNPRSGRSMNVIIALLIYITYSNLMSICQAWIAQGKISPWVGLWPVHLGVILIAVVLFLRRSRLLSFPRRGLTA
jgi:lipopolysaccharide export system permease protein